MLDFVLARVCINAGHSKIGVICKFKNAVSLMNRMQVVRSD